MIETQEEQMLHKKQMENSVSKTVKKLKSKYKYSKLILVFACTLSSEN